MVRCNADVWVFDVTPLEAEGIESAVVDVSDFDEVGAAVQRVAESAATIDVLVNNAGSLNDNLPFDELEPDEWRRVIDVNLGGTLNLCRHVVPHMRLAGRGRIVNVGSLAGKEGPAPPRALLRGQRWRDRLHEGPRQGGGR